MRNSALVLVCCLIVGCATTDGKLLSFQTEPTTSEERAVAQRMESSMKAYNAKQLDLHGAHYAPDARIHSLVAGGMVTREQYLAALKTSTQLPHVSLEQAKITMLAPDRSRITGVLNTVGVRSATSRPVTYDFVKRNGEWFIIEQRY